MILGGTKIEEGISEEVGGRDQDRFRRASLKGSPLCLLVRGFLFKVQVQGIVAEEEGGGEDAPAAAIGHPRA